MKTIFFLYKIGHFHVEVQLHMRKIILDYESCPCVVEPGLPPGGQPSTDAPILIYNRSEFTLANRRSHMMSLALLSITSVKGSKDDGLK